MQQGILYFDGKCKLCISITHIIHRLDFSHQFDLIDLWTYNAEYLHRRFNKNVTINSHELKETVHLVDSDGHVYKGYYAFRQLSRKIPLLFIVRLFSYLPFSSYIGEKLYDFVASNRYKLNACGCNVSCKKAVI